MGWKVRLTQRSRSWKDSSRISQDMKEVINAKLKGHCAQGEALQDFEQERVTTVYMQVIEQGKAETC